jgi:1A family penicillin-binding protein
VAESTKLYDRTGKIVLYDVHKDIRRTQVPIEAISPAIRNATIAIEDEKFYEHAGIEPKAILRAILVNLRLREGYLGQGGSTITQQVIKNALLTKEKTITRKVKEWILAIKLERTMTKEQILTLYLNESPYGGNIYGIEEAAQSFFGKRAADVTIVEAAYLAALPQAPTTYSPYGSHTDLLEERKNLVLQKMLGLRMITAEEYAAARTEKVSFVPPQERGIRAPHFVMYVKQLLADRFGDELLHEGGLRVITTIDLDLQSKAEDAVRAHAQEQEVQFRAKNSAMVAIDPKTGGILAMVGSRDYFDMENDGNFNIAIAKRQPGSAFKPFVYAAGFELGYTPKTALFDVPTQFSTRCDAFGTPLPGSDESHCYMPENYDHTYRGPMSVRDALAQSVNVPAVKMLYLVGLDRALEFAERLGITTLGDKKRYGLTLVLGGGEVSLLDMTSAYGVFANDGIRVPSNAILRIEDSQGVLIEEYIPDGKQVIEPEIARRISDILSDNDARTPAFGASSYLHFPERKVAVKTGTTNDYRDAWIVGYTPSLVVGAWVGNNDNTSMEKKVAGFIVAPMWNEFFRSAFSSLPEEVFPTPRSVDLSVKPALRGVWAGAETYLIDRVSGKLATALTPPQFIEEKVIPNPHEILYFVSKDDPTGAPPVNPYNDPQYLLWEIPAQQWILANGLPSLAWGVRPTDTDDIHTSTNAPRVTLPGIHATSTFLVGDRSVITPLIASTYAVANIDYFLDTTLLGSSKTPPFEMVIIPQDSHVGVRTLRLFVRDVVGNTTTIEALITVVRAE